MVAAHSLPRNLVTNITLPQPWSRMVTTHPMRLSLGRVQTSITEVPTIGITFMRVLPNFLSNQW
jgi:hypothetical protein